MSSYYKLGFSTDEGKKVSINVYNPDKTVSKDYLKSTMDTFATAGIIQTKSGLVNGEESVHLVEVQKKEFNVAQE